MWTALVAVLVSRDLSLYIVYIVYINIYIYYILYLF